MWGRDRADASHSFLVIVPSYPSSKAARLLVRLAPRDLGCLDGAHLLRPTRSGGKLADGADLVRGEAGDADVIVALQHQLDIPGLQRVVRAQLRDRAGRRHDLVDEVVRILEHGLDRVSENRK